MRVKILTKGREMKKQIFLLAMICLAFLSFSSCDALAEKVAMLILDGGWTTSLTSYGSPQFVGYVKNTGNGTAYNASIEITCYSDTAKTTIIDTATGFPANLGDIPPGARAYFEAISFNTNSHEDIKATDYTIDWLDRD